jgi:hypothetical protein
LVINDTTEWPLTVTLRGSELDVFDEALIHLESATKNEHQYLDPVSSRRLVLTFDSLRDLPTLPEGKAMCVLTLRSNGGPELQVELPVQDFLQQATVSGVSEAFAYSNRIASDDAGYYTRMREQADAESSATDILRNGDVLEILNEQEAWYQARIRESGDPEAVGRIYWIEKWLVDGEPAPPTPTPTPVPPTAAPVRPTSPPVQVRPTSPPVQVRPTSPPVQVRPTSPPPPPPTPVPTQPLVF